MPIRAAHYQMANSKTCFELLVSALLQLVLEEVLGYSLRCRVALPQLVLDGRDPCAHSGS